MRKTDKQESAVAFADFTLPQFQRSGYRVNITKARTASGKNLEFSLWRQI